MIGEIDFETLELTTPQKTVLFFEKTEGMEKIELVQFFKYKIEETKKPVYGYDNKAFSTVIGGKRIASGIIGITKFTKDIVGAMYERSADSQVRSEADNSLEMYKLFKMNEFFTLDETVFLEYKKKIFDHVKEIHTQKNSVDSFLDIGKNGLLSNLSLKVYDDVEKADNENSFFTIKNITFTAKEGEISVGSTDITEIYSFFGNV